jgi:hypothetical protein
MGRVSCIWWPPTRWRDFSGFSKTLRWRTIVTVVSALLFVRLFLGRSWRQHFEDAGGKLRADHYYVNRCAFGLPITVHPIPSCPMGHAQTDNLSCTAAQHRQKRPTPTRLRDYAGPCRRAPGERVFLDNGKLQFDVNRFRNRLACRTRIYLRRRLGPYGRSKGKEYSLVPEGAYFICRKQYPGRPLGQPDGGLGAAPALIGVATAIWWPPRRWRRTRA